MDILLLDEAHRQRICEVEEEPEARFVLTVPGFLYYFERRGQTESGMPVFYLVDAERDGEPSSLS